MARKLGARNGLPLADQIQDDAAIDVARGPAGGAFEIVQIDFLHERLSLCRAVTEPNRCAGGRVTLTRSRWRGKRKKGAMPACLTSRRTSASLRGCYE